MFFFFFFFTGSLLKIKRGLKQNAISFFKKQLIIIGPVWRKRDTQIKRARSSGILERVLKTAKHSASKSTSCL